MFPNARILVVDDDNDVRQFLSDFLEKQQYTVVTAKNGYEALEKYHEVEPDLIISDMVMEGLNGMELLEKLYTIDNEIVFLMITGYPSIDTAVEAIKKGAYDYVTKPFNTKELKVRIEQALRVRRMQKKLKITRGLMIGLIFSIPVWLFLGTIIAFFLYRN